MSYIKNAHRYILYIQLLVLIVSVFATIALSSYIFVVPELHSQLLDSSLDGKYLMFSYSSSNRFFDQIFHLHIYSKNILLLVTGLFGLYLATGTRLKTGVKAIGKNEYIQEVLILLIFPYLLYGIVGVICNTFISFPFAAYPLYLSSLAILWLELIILYYLLIWYSNYKYLKLPTKELLLPIWLVIWTIISFLIFFSSLAPIITILQLVAVYYLTNYLQKKVRTQIGI